jgi:hypothetical protein
MKKLLALAILIATSITRLFAQDNAANMTEKLIKEKNFVFVATRVRQKPGFNGSFEPLVQTSFGSVNVGNVSMATSLAITSQNVGSYLQQEYYQNSGNGSYFNAYGIKESRGPVEEDTKATVSAFLIQYPDQFMIRGGGNPSSLEEANETEFKAFLTGGYRLKSSKKGKNGWSLVYEVGKDESLRKYYLDILEDGKAILKAQPNEKFTTYLYGYIVSPTQLVSK